MEQWKSHCRVWWTSNPAHTTSNPAQIQVLVQDGQQEALEISAAFRGDGFLQGHIIFFQVHVFNGFQINLGKQNSVHYMTDDGLIASIYTADSTKIQFWM